MTPQEAETKFHEIGCYAFVELLKMPNGDIETFFEYVRNKKPCVFDEGGFTRSYILDAIELFEGNPDLYKKKVEQVTQLKLL